MQVPRTASRNGKACRGAVVTPCPGRNAPCPCGTGRKYKHCCLERHQAQRRSRLTAQLPPWMVNSRHKLRQFEKYCCQVFDLPAMLQRYTDARHNPVVATRDVVNALFHTAVLRVPSINALEGNLKEADFQKLIGCQPRQDVKPFSADVVADVLDTLRLEAAQRNVVDVFWRAERNKAFRDQTFGSMRCVAIDGWESFCSYHRHCDECLEREVESKDEVRTQYYHRYVVAVLVGPLLDIVLAIEPVRNKAARIRAGETNVEGDEGELTAAMRLVDNLHQTYGAFIDALVFDSLYPNGPVLTKLTKLNYSAFIVVKKDDTEPLKEALALWAGHKPCRVVDDDDAGEHIEFWDVDAIETLETYKGKIRVFRAIITKPGQKKRTWCVAAIGTRARRAPLTVALKAMRARWHIENTVFHQWVKYWNFNHVFRHTRNATRAVILIFTLAFNLVQLFVYRRLKRPRRPKDPNFTIRHIIAVMNRQIAALPKPIPWDALFDTS